MLAMSPEISVISAGHHRVHDPQESYTVFILQVGNFRDYNVVAKNEDASQECLSSKYSDA